MTDGAESLLRLKKLLPVPTRLVLDYFHVAMKVRHADQCIVGIPPYHFSPDGSVFELYDRFNYLRGYLWIGHLCELEGYLRKNAAGIINYREWRRAGRRISTSAVEGTVNRLIGRRMCKSQQMCWTKRGAHLLLQVCCAVFNGDLPAGFQRWFPAVGSCRIVLPWHWLHQQ
jgi:hypothetical protein